MLIIGLTGGIASGKTTVSDLFSALGITVVDADIAAREVVAPGCEALASIQQHFGAAVINTDGSLNRQALREKIFNDESERHWLEALLHPLIRQRLRQQLQQLAQTQQPSYAILSSPLLLETSQHQLVDRVLVVDITEQQQLARASTRDNNSSEQIKAIMAAQMNRETRNTHADDIILNDSSKEALKTKVLALHQHYLELAKDHRANHD